MSDRIPIIDRPPAGWFALDVMRAGSSRRWDWCALMVDVDPDELKHCLCKIAFLYVHPDEYRPDRTRVAQEAWVSIPASTGIRMQPGTPYRTCWRRGTNRPVSALFGRDNHRVPIALAPVNSAPASVGAFVSLSTPIPSQPQQLSSRRTELYSMHTDDEGGSPCSREFQTVLRTSWRGSVTAQ